MVDFKVDTREKGIYSASSKYALIVGVSEFTDDWITDLVYADNDAYNFYQTLAVHNQYSKENIIMIIDSDAYKEAIITGLMELANKANNENDLLIFMYSGHGASIGGESYILPSDAKIAKEDNIGEEIKPGDLLVDTLISVTELKEAVGSSIANRVFFLDACRTNVVSGEKAGAVIAEVERLNNEDINIDDVIIISATQQGMPSYESSTYMASYMSYSLNDGLRGDADMDESGFISIEELSGYMYKRVKELCLEEGRDGSQELSIMNVGVDSDIFLGFSMFGWDSGASDGLDLQVMEQDELNTIIAGTTEFPEKKLNTFNECYAVFTDAEKMLSNENYEEAQMLYNNVVELVAQTPYKMEGDENFESLYNISLSKSEAIMEYLEDIAEQEQKRNEMEQITDSFNKAVESYNAANSLEEYLAARDFILDAVNIIYVSPYKAEDDYVRSLAQLQEWLEEIDKWVLAKAFYGGDTSLIKDVILHNVNLNRPWYQSQREKFNISLIYLPNGDRYEGEVIDGEPHGHGIFYFANGDRYEGEFIDGKMHGYGIYYWTNDQFAGDRYEGEFIDGKMHGYGIYYWANGDRYEGDWIDEKKHGQGIYYWTNDPFAGDRYEGEWIDGNIAGGWYYRTDGTKEWRDN
jgi:hypothetical protein